jgi:formate hydrogenlyase subunit 3/multisubunit Na+/H+ antiporter MnhD subunit
MTAPPWLLSLPVVFPLILGVFTLLIPAHTLKQAGKTGALATAVTTLPCLQWVWQAGPLHQTLGGWGAPLGIDLYLDGLSCLFLLFAALTGLGISFYATEYFPQSAEGHRSRTDLFWPLWFVTWGGINSLFLTLDLFNIYVTLELISIAGTGLILIAGTRGAIRAALQYQMQALIAGLVYLLGVGLVYNTLGTLDLQLIAADLSPSPMILTGLALMVTGLLIKAALFPVHFWLPPAHADAPAPVSAVLSGLVVTVAYVIVFRLWFAGFHTIAPDLVPRLMGVLGAVGIVWGGLLALRQERLKRVLAYSTVSQVGYLFLVFSLTLDSPAAEGLVWAGTVYMAVAHGLAKSAAFLAAGCLQKTEGSDTLTALRGAALRQPAAVIVLALASINLIGLPPSTGFIGKWMLLKASFYTRQWGIAFVILGGGLLAAAYLFRVFEVLMNSRAPDNMPDAQRDASPLPLSRGILFPAMLLALATLIPVLYITAPEELLRIGAPVSFSRFITPGAAQ